MSPCISSLQNACMFVPLQVAEACKGAGGGSVELLEMDAGSKESVTAVAKAVEGEARCPLKDIETHGISPLLLLGSALAKSSDRCVSLWSFSCDVAAFWRHQLC